MTGRGSSSVPVTRCIDTGCTFTYRLKGLYLFRGTQQP